MRAQAIITAVKNELVHYPGVDMEIHHRGKHQRATFIKNGDSRFLTLPLSPSDWRAGKNAVRDFHKTMRELGAQRLDILPGQKKGLRTRTADAGVGLHKGFFTVHINSTSALLGRFKDENDRAKAHWQLEFRASPDLEAPPLVVLKRVTMPPGRERVKGVVGGFKVRAGGGWRMQWARNSFPALRVVDKIPSVDVELVNAGETEIVFKLPTGILPTAFKAPPKPAAPVDTPAETWPTDMPVKEAIAQSQPEPVDGFVDKPIVLQLPKQPVSVEAALLVLNKHKRRLGSNLRFTVTEGGFLTATHRIGY